MSNIAYIVRETARRLAEGEAPDEIASALTEEAEAVEEANIDGMISLSQCDQDWDEEQYYNSIGMSEYDLNPGVQYNDAGEPLGYM